MGGEVWDVRCGGVGGEVWGVGGEACSERNLGKGRRRVCYI